MKILTKIASNPFFPLFMCVLLWPGTSITAQERTARERAAQVSREILSPYCPGRLLSDCPSSAASDLKKEIEQRISKGESEQEVKESLYTLYGSEIRAAPEMSGVGYIAWLAPAVFLLFGLIVLMLWLKRRRATEADMNVSRETIDPNIKNLIDQVVRGDE